MHVMGFKWHVGWDCYLGWLHLNSVGFWKICFLWGPVWRKLLLDNEMPCQFSESVLPEKKSFRMLYIPNNWAKSTTISDILSINGLPSSPKFICIQCAKWVTFFIPLSWFTKEKQRSPFRVSIWFGQFIATKPPFGHPKWCFSKGIFNYRLVDVGGSKDVLMCIFFWRMIVKFIKRLDYFAAGRPWFESTSYIRLDGLGYMLFWGCLIFVFPWLTDFYWLPRTWEVPYWMHDRHGSMDERGHDPFWKKKKVSKLPKTGPLVV